MKFVYDFINNVLPLIGVFIFVGGLSAIVGWWRGYDSGHRAGYEDGRIYGYNFRELELQQERNRIQAAEEERKKQNVAKKGRRKGGGRSETI